MKLSTQLLSLFVVLFSLMGFVHADESKPGQQAKTFETMIPVRLGYLLYVPDEYGKDASKKWPVILFLHGAGERGSDIELVKVHGPPKLVANKTDLPVKDFIVISPQCPDEDRWYVPALLALLDDVMKDLEHADPDRLYVTGLSMGAFGTWDLASRAPKRFAAIAPICGGGSERAAKRLDKMPIWAFHGDRDKAVPVEASIKMVNAVKETCNTEVKLTRYPEAEHDSWTETYNNPELYTWFLKHKRRHDDQTASNK